MIELSLILSILPMLVLDVALPLSDNVSDLALILRWYLSGHAKYATGMLIPFLMNVCGNIYNWWKWDSKKEKKFTWMLLILQLWPVYRAIKVIILIFKKDPHAEEAKNKFECQIAGLEAY